MKKRFIALPLPLLLVGSLCAMDVDTLPMDSSSTTALSIKLLSHYGDSHSTKEIEELLAQGADINSSFPVYL